MILFHSVQLKSFTIYFHFQDACTTRQHGPDRKGVTKVVILEGVLGSLFQAITATGKGLKAS